MDKIDGRSEERGERIPLWLDCDPDEDEHDDDDSNPTEHFPSTDAEVVQDAFAILLSAYHPSLVLLGISTVHGNASLEQTTNNALSILDTIGQSDVPVFAGAKKPFCRVAQHAPEIHGKSGLDGTDLLSQPSKGASDGDTIHSMHDELMKCPPNTAWLVTTGSLTNAALLFATFPEVGDHIRGLSVMGGAIGSDFTSAQLGRFFKDGSNDLRAPVGNYAPYAEFNIWCDPESAQAIFSNPALSKKTTLITLDLTHQVLAAPSVQRMILHGQEKAALAERVAPHQLRRMFYELLVFFTRTYSEVFGLTDGPPLHDPLAVAVLLADLEHQNGGIEFDDRKGERFEVEIQLSGPQLGRSIAEGASEGVRIPRGVDIDAFWAVLDSCLDRAIERLGKTDG